MALHWFALGVCRSAPSTSGSPTIHPAKLEHGVVLATVKVWPVDVGASIEVGVTANLDGVCARRQRAAKPEWTTARCAASRHLTKRAQKYLGNKVE